MIITGMAHFESVCKKKLVDWYRRRSLCHCGSSTVGGNL